jgi:hypothetical protein
VVRIGIGKGEGRREDGKKNKGGWELSFFIYL